MMPPAGLLEQLVKAQNGLCAYGPHAMTWRGPRRATLDHMVPLWRWAGAQWDPANLCAACETCNTLKGGLDAETFRAVRDDPVRLRAMQAAARAAWREAGRALSAPSWRSEVLRQAQDEAMT